MFEHRDPIGSQFVTYELNADDFDLCEGDTIKPGSEIGIDVRSGSAVYLNNWGRVASVYYYQMNESYLVSIQRLSKNRPGSGASTEKDLISV
jgi:hypothetical protein